MRHEDYDVFCLLGRAEVELVHRDCALIRRTRQDGFVQGATIKSSP